VLFPAGTDATSDVVVVAEDGARRLHAHVQEGGRYQIHLPPGRYTLVASADDLVGVVPDVLARGDVHDIDIRLGLGAAIRGKLSGSAEAAVSATSGGGNEEAGVPHVEDGAFAIEGLIPGRRYDLSFTGPDVRTLTITGVTAPADGLDVALQARAKISGAIGFPAGSRCPINSVRLRIDGKPESDDDDDTSTDVGRDCRFALSVPDQAAEVTVVATGTGWYLEERVAIPTAGDPAPICLNPPCPSEPPLALARLRLTLDTGAEASSITAHVNSVYDSTIDVGSLETHSCAGSGGRCDIEGLHAGDTFSITAFGRGCRADPIKLTVVAGDNHVRIPCQRQRRIEGVIRVPDGEEPDWVVVRCAGGDSHPMYRTRLFRLTCDADVGALEYQIGTQGTWRLIPIASLSNPAFVDIGPF
jgi:hypothetical protein